MTTNLKEYLYYLPWGRQILWCYLIWYLVMVGFHFDSRSALWLNSLGIAALVGLALFISTGPCTISRFQSSFWPSLRLFACPFLVSSFSALVKGKGFILLFSTSAVENATALAACGVFLLLIKTIQLQIQLQQKINHVAVGDTPDTDLGGHHEPRSLS